MFNLRRWLKIREKRKELAEVLRRHRELRSIEGETDVYTYEQMWKFSKCISRLMGEIRELESK